MADRRITNNAHCKIETRADGGKTLVGYGAVFFRADDPGTEYRLGSDLYERVSRTAFDRAIKEKADVRGLYNHNPNVILGRTAAGTMRLSVDDTGLRYEIDLPDTTQARDVAALIERGDVTGSSFSFRTIKQSFSRDSSRRADVRQLEDLEVLDVGPVTFPAYEATTAAMRAEGDGAEAVTDRDAWARQREAESVAVRLRAIDIANKM